MAEESKADPLAELVKKWEAIAKDPKKVDALTQIDEVRRLEFKNRMARAQREKDPFMKSRREAQAYGVIRNDLAYFVGQELLPGVKVADEQRLPLLRATGNDWLNDNYNMREE